MKIILTLAAGFLMVVYVFLSCTKEPKGPAPAPVNLPPVARAGADTFFTLTSCSQRASFFLDGSSSTDPEGKPLGYFWRWISGPAVHPPIQFSNFVRARVENLPPGNHAFELSVTDVGRLSSSDTILVSVKGATPKEYELDMSFNSTFTFKNNFEDCYYTCTYNDQTEIWGTASFTPLGQLTLYLFEYADSADSKYATNSSFDLYITNNINAASIYGTCSVNLKKLIQQGGGAFDGSFTVKDGSAKNCDPKILESLPPLTVKGNLDTATRRVTINLKGKAFF